MTRIFCLLTLLSTLLLLPASALPALASSSQSAALAQGEDPALLVAFDPNFPPYQFMQDGLIAGAHVDMLDKIAAELGIAVYYLPLTSTAACLSALEQDQVDLVLGVPYGQTRANAQFALTEPTSQAQLCMIANTKNVERILNNRGFVTAAYQDGLVDFGFMRAFSTLRTIPVSNQVRAFRALEQGHAQAMIGVKSSIDYQLRQRKSTQDYAVVNNYMLPIEFSMAVRADHPELLRHLNAQLYQLRINGEYERIHNRWIDDGSAAQGIFLKQVMLFSGIAGLVISLVIAATLHLNHLLKLQVAKKTEELQQKNLQLTEQIAQTNTSNEIRNCVVESSPAAILVLDNNLQITLLNQSARNLFFAPTLQVGSALAGVPMLQQLMGDRLSCLTGDAAQTQHWEGICLTPSGREVVYSVSLYLLYQTDPEGHALMRGATINVLDATTEARRKEEIFEREKSRALNRIIAGIAHEIRNPLTAIKTYTNLLPTKLHNPDFQQQLVDCVPREVDRVNTLITDLIDYARPKTRHMETIFVAEVVGSCHLLLEPMFKNSRVDILLELEEGMQLRCDRAQLRQVLINLLLNSVEAIDQKREVMGQQQRESIRIRAQQDAAYAFIEVIDSGIGMTEQELGCATEAFYTTKATGTGLGLSLSKQYIEENGGKLLVQSQKCHYTCVTIRFEREML